jgi:Tfp pilus assembly protein PilF
MIEPSPISTDALRHNPKSATAYVSRGICYVEKNHPNKAIADFTEAIRLVPTNPTFYLSRALAYRALGDEAKAASDEKRAQELKK